MPVRGREWGWTQAGDSRVFQVAATMEKRPDVDMLGLGLETRELGWGSEAAGRGGTPCPAPEALAPA